MFYIVPTLTSDIIGQDAVLNGHMYNLTGCTSVNATDCGTVSNSSAGVVINPVQSARITTRNSHNIQFGKVEIRAKLPRGYTFIIRLFHSWTDAFCRDWLWPALWMLPVNDDYGIWPASG